MSEEIPYLFPTYKDTRAFLRDGSKGPIISKNLDVTVIDVEIDREFDTIEITTDDGMYIWNYFCDTITKVT